MDFRIGTDKTTRGGSDGCISFTDPDNAGLPSCIEEFQLAKAYAPVCDSVSLADWLVVAGEAVMGRTAVDYDPKEPFKAGTLAATFRDGFKFGRVTNTACTSNDPLPNPEHGCGGLDEIFNKHIFARTTSPWPYTAAISGAHTLG